MDCLPKSQDLLYGRKHSKDKEKGVYAHENGTHAPGASTMYLGQGIFTLMHQAMHLGHAGSGLELFFPTFKCKISNFQALTQVETKSINSTPLIHNFSFRTKWFKRKARTESLKGGVSPHSKSLAYVLLLL